MVVKYFPTFRGPDPMNLGKLSDVIQIISGVVLIIGVVLVVLQMRQTETLTRAQMVNEAWAMRIQQAEAAAGENPMRSYAKLCSENEFLTDEDVLVLHNFYLQRMYLIYRAKVVNDIAFNDDQWRREVTGNLGMILGTEQGRAWMHTWQLQPWFQQLVDEHEATVSTSCVKRHPAFHSIMNTDRNKVGGSQFQAPE